MKNPRTKNTYGPNRFREVRVRCTECKGSKVTNMQCDTGLYNWDCDLCGDQTVHRVTETEPLSNNPRVGA